MNQATPPTLSRETSQFSVESLSVRIFRSLDQLAATAAQEVSDYLVGVIQRQGAAHVILATGNSQIVFLRELVRLAKLSADPESDYYLRADSTAREFRCLAKPRT